MYADVVGRDNVIFKGHRVREDGNAFYASLIEFDCEICKEEVTVPSGVQLNKQI